MERASPSDMQPKREQRDKELDKKIQALRQKNQALMRRYQEVEEDKKKAEEEGKALQNRKGKADDLTITINNSTTEPRVVVTRPGAGLCGDAREGCPLGAGRARTRQLLVTMAGNHSKGVKRVVSERMTRRGPGPHNHPLEDRPPRAALEGRARPPYGGETGAQDEMRQTEERYSVLECELYYQDAELTGQTELSVSREEQQEYLRWKKEREQIDRERVARHKNSKGQWRRAWDLDKTDHMFSDKSHGERDRGPQTKGGKSARKGYPKSVADSGGHHTRGKGDEGGKKVPVVGSKAKGKDRLTGRARRWDADEDGGLSRASDTSLEEFLEELDAMGDPEGDQPIAKTPRVTEGDPKTESSPLLEVVSEEGVGVEQLAGLPSSLPDNPPEGETETASHKSPEKKVRFSDELIQEARHNDACRSNTRHEYEEPTDTQEASAEQPAGEAQTQSSLVGQGQPPKAPEPPTAPKTDRGDVCSPAPSSPTEERACGPPQDVSVQDVSAQDVSAQDVSAQDVSAQDVSAQDVSAQDVSAQDVSAQDVSAQDVSAQDVSAQDVSAQDVSAQDVSAQDVSAQDVSAQDVSAQDVSAQDVSAQDVSVQDVSVQDVSVQDVSVQDVSVQDVSVQDVSVQDVSVQPVEHAKSISRKSEELLDSSLSVLTLESGQMNPAHTTSTDKAREHGKIV